MSGWRETSLGDLLAEHGLDGASELPIETDGWSGARFSRLDVPAAGFVLKRTSLRTDWIAAATDDHDLREATLAAARPVPSAFAAPPIPYLGAAADGDEAAILLPDLSSELVAWDRPGHEGPLPPGDLDRVLAALARLHGHPWPAGLEPFPWCPLPERLLLTSRSMCARHLASGIPAGVASAERLLAGWDAFDGRAPAAARDLVASLEADPSPLVAALGRLPAVGLHGDLKLANVALGPATSDVVFIDWQMTLVAPIAVELGWLLVSNSGSLGEEPAAVVERYLQHLAAADPTGAVVGDREAQRDLAWIVGLVLRGWRKGLDAEAGTTLASGVAGANDLAWWCDAATEAAARRL